MKITIIGGGSYSWAPNLLSDFLVTDFFDGAELCLMDIDQVRLDHISAVAVKLCKLASIKIKVTTTTSLSESLCGSNYVIVAVSIGTWPASYLDHSIARKHGFWNLKGHDIGAAGFARSLRHVPFMLHVARQMEKICPGAMLLNVTNPLVVNTKCVNQYTSIKCFGFCHGVVNHTMAVAKVLGARDYGDIDFVTAGIDHCSWLLKFTVRGQNAFDLMNQRDFKKKAWENKTITAADDKFAGIEEQRLRFIIWDMLGFFPAIGDYHICEFFPQFMRNAELRKLWNLYYDRIIERPKTIEYHKDIVLKMLSGSVPVSLAPSGEIIARTIAAFAGREDFVDVLNVPNVGQINNLPMGAILETKVRVSRSGIEPIKVGALPGVLEAIVRNVLAIEQLYMEAAFEWDKSKAVAALSIDPIVADFRSTRKMVDEYFVFAESALGAANIKIGSWQ